MAGLLNWFEIPVEDFDRAKKFYEEVFGFEIGVQQFGEHKMGFFPQVDGVSGAIVKGEGYVPNPDGVQIYFNGGDDLGVPLEKVEGAGGRVIQHKSLITEDIGYMAVFFDTEGNRIALHSMG